MKSPSKPLTSFKHLLRIETGRIEYWCGQDIGIRLGGDSVMTRSFRRSNFCDGRASLFANHSRKANWTGDLNHKQPLRNNLKHGIIQMDIK